MASQPPPSSPDPPLQLLLIEDNPGDADLIRVLLRQTELAPARVDTAQRLAEACDRLVHTRYDAALLDLSLPDSEGLDTVQSLVAAVPDLAVVVLTGRNDAALGQAAVRAGAQDYLVKGHVDPPALAQALRHALERKRASLELIRERSRLKQMLDCFPLAVLIVSPACEVEYANARCRTEFGDPGRRKCHAYLEDRADPCSRCAKPSVATGLTTTAAWHSQRTRRDYDIVTIPLVNTDGTFSHLEVFRDVTDQQQATATLQHQAQELQERNRELSRFNDITVGRELRMVQLKQEINELCQRLGEPPRYHLETPALPTPPAP